MDSDTLAMLLDKVGPGLFVAVIVALMTTTNPWGLDWTQRLSLMVALSGAAVFGAHTLVLHNRMKTPQVATAPADGRGHPVAQAFSAVTQSTGNGNNINVQGNGNSLNIYPVPPPAMPRAELVRLHRDALIASLRAAGTFRYLISVVSADPDSRNLAQALSTTFSDAGWQPVRNGIATGFMNGIDNVVVSRRASAVSPTAAAVVSSALAGAGLELQDDAYGNSFAPDGSIEILVGRRTGG